MSRKYCIPYGNHPSQFGELWMPDDLENCPVVVTIHGGFWQAKYDLYENNPICKDLMDRGFATWNIEYRRVGEKGGGWPGTFNDVVAAVNHLAKLKNVYKIDLANVVIIGHSAGGHLGLWLAARSKVTGDEDIFTELVVPIGKVISLAGVTDLKKMWNIHHKLGINSVVGNLLGGSPLEQAERYAIASPIKLLPDNIEQILIHGELDKHVPVELSKEYYEKLQRINRKVSLTVLKDIEHFKLINPSSSAWETVIQAI